MIVIADTSWTVYIHTNKTNGKRYIGITSQHPPEKRWLNGHGYSRELPFGRAVQKYGWDGFIHEILFEGVDENRAKEIEKSLIERFKTQDDSYGYNITAGGEGVTGLKHSDESKLKMSEAKSGDRHPNFGKHLPEETRMKIGRANMGNKNCLGVTRSAETRERMSASKRKPVVMYNTNGLALRSFDSAKAAEEATGVSRKNISTCCKGQRKSAGGYAWSFA